MVDALSGNQCVWFWWENVVQIERLDASNLTVLDNIGLDELQNRMIQNPVGILFIVEKNGRLVGSLTKGDLLRANMKENPSAQEICNRSPRKVFYNLADSEIAKHFSPRIQCIPCIDEEERLVEVARIKPKSQQLNLNIGAGQTYFDGFTNLDVSSDWYASHHQQNAFIEYNILTDRLPFDDASVDNIYCSHVIEHIQNADAERFFAESARVLKPGGVMRIACPDAEFLYQVSRFDNDYWFWRRSWFEVHPTRLGLADLTQWDFLVREMATARVDQLHDQKPVMGDEDMYGVLIRLVEGLEFDLDRVGNHINFWTFDKVRQMLGERFRYVLRSKYQGCVNPIMTGDQFDKTAPNMSLYVDCIK